jgi:transcriptional regulator with XRE-family HTH domain
MKPLEKSDKEAIKLRFAVGLNKLLLKSEISSLKKLARESGMEPSHIQKIAAGKVDVSLTTAISLATAFGISYSELATSYEGVKPDDIQKYLDEAKLRKEHKGKAKIPVKKSTGKGKK